MVKKPNRNRWDPSFDESLRQKKEKDEAEFLAWTQARTEGVKRTMAGQHRKDQYDRIMREFDDPEKREEIKVDGHKRRIAFLEQVLKENKQWRERFDEPLQLKPNIVDLQTKINEMNDYVNKVSKGSKDSPARQVKKKPVPISKPPELTSEQVAEIYERAQESIQLAFSGVLSRLAKNVRMGLPIERARERLITLGVSKHVVDALNEVSNESALALSGNEKKALKLVLLHPDQLGSFLDGIIESVQ
jgi:hypothetical protein